MQGKQGEVHNLLIAMLVIPTVIIVARFWSRALSSDLSTSRVPARFWWDDWTALVAAILNIAVCGIGMKLLQLGLGQHIEAVDPRNIEPFLKLLWVEYFLFDAGIAVAKSSALFFYVRVFGAVKPWFKYSLWAVHALNIAWSAGILLAVIFECSPIRKAWQSVLPGTCVNTQTLFLGSGISSLLIDVIILIIPLPILWNLQLKLARKIQVVIVFICAYLVIVVPIGRLVTIFQTGPGLALDPTYKIATPVLWLGSEIAISVTSVSLPSLLYLAQRARRDGARSLISNRTRHSSGLVDRHRGTDHNRSQDGSETELGHSFKHVDNIQASSTESHITGPRRAGQSEWQDADLHRIKSSGLHVRNDIVVS